MKSTPRILTIIIFISAAAGCSNPKEAATGASGAQVPGGTSSTATRSAEWSLNSSPLSKKQLGQINIAENNIVEVYENQLVWRHGDSILTITPIGESECIAEGCFCEKDRMCRSTRERPKWHCTGGSTTTCSDCEDKCRTDGLEALLIQVAQRDSKNKELADKALDILSHGAP